MSDTLPEQQTMDVTANLPSGGRWPTFLIVGMAKAGTSSLYAYLRQHPQIFVSPVRTPNFFGLGEQPVALFGGPIRQRPSLSPTVAQYCALFATAQNEIALGEGSSFFNFTPRAALRIHQYIPDAKLLFILRQPAERAYSQYLYARQVGWEPAFRFTTALRDERRRQAEEWFPFLCYRQSSSYAATLRTFYTLFPSHQIHISLFDDFRRNTAAVVRDIYTFLGVDSSFTPDVSVNHNPTRVGLLPWLRSPNNQQTAAVWRYVPVRLRRYLFRGLDRFAVKRSLTPPLYRQLTDEFRADILETQEITGKDLSHWLTYSST